MKRTIATKTTYVFLTVLCMAFAIACKKDKPPKALKDFVQVNLVGNNDEYSPARVDPSLVNAWGISWAGSGIAWVSSMAGHVSEVYDREGAEVRAAVPIPSPAAATGGLPTGQVNNAGAGFLLSNGQPARFIFVGVDGVLSGWNPTAGANAILVKDNSATSAYTGLTMAMSGGTPHLYAADFRANRIEVWDQDWTTVAMPFIDPHIPPGYAPFNVQLVGTLLYVTYAKVAPEGDEETGPGKGFVSIFTTEGQLVRRFASRGALNAPWGIAQAHDSFFADTEDGNMKKGGHGNELNGPILLVGNFGDGRINAFTQDGQFLGALRKHGHDIVIEGLWAISFPPATSTIDPNRLYFAAGPDDEENGLFGYIR
jgi:uncharacterized protein (TIGR03118 family)